jgi:hypothetical protein
MCVVNEESGFWSIILFQEIMWGRGYNYGYLLMWKVIFFEQKKDLLSKNRKSFQINLKTRLIITR